MQYTKEVYRREFTDAVSKQAYLKACKWLAQNVYVSPSYSESIVVKIRKKDKRDTKNGVLFVFEVVLYYSADLNNAKDRFCNNCRQMHETFYSNKPQCSECKLKVFVTKIENEVAGITNSLMDEFGGSNEQNT
jgi:hypothetical protein